MSKRSRLDLHEILCETLGSRNVYFQPPESIKLKYPCIVYERSYVQTLKADNLNYISINRYTVTVIDKNPDSGIADKLLNLPYTSFDRHFVSDNLNHDVLTLYY